MSALWNFNIQEFLREIESRFSANPVDFDEKTDLARYIYQLFTVADGAAWNDNWTFPGAEYCRSLEERWVFSTRFHRPFFSFSERELIKLFYGFKEIEVYILSQVAEVRKISSVKIVSSYLMSNAPTLFMGCAASNYLIPLMQRYFFKIYWLFSNSLRLRRIELGMLPEVLFYRDDPSLDYVPASCIATVSTPTWQGQPDSLKRFISDLRDGSGVMLKQVGEGFFSIPLADFLQQYHRIIFSDFLPVKLLQQHMILVQLMRYFNIYSWLTGDTFTPASVARAEINATQIVVDRLLDLYFASLFAILFHDSNLNYYRNFGMAYVFPNEEMLSSGSDSSGNNSDSGGE